MESKTLVVFSLRTNHSHKCPLCAKDITFYGKCDFAEKACPAILRHVNWCGTHEQQPKQVGVEIKGWCSLHTSFQPCRWCENLAERTSKPEDDSPLEPKEV